MDGKVRFRENMVPRSETTNMGTSWYGEAGSDGAGTKVAQVFKVSESQLNKTEFSYREFDGSIRTASDNRERVWKLWSRIIEGMEDGLSQEKKAPITRMKDWLNISRHFVLPRKADQWSGRAYNTAVRQRNGKEIPQNEWMDLIRSMFHTFVLPFKVCAIHLPGESVAILVRLVEGGDNDFVNADTDVSGMAGVWGFIIMHPTRQPTPQEMERMSGVGSSFSHSTFCLGCIEQSEEAIFESVGGDAIAFSVTPVVRYELMSNGAVIQAWHCEDEERSGEEGNANPVDVIGESAQAAFDLLVAIQSHKKFIVQVNQKQKKKLNKKAKRKQFIRPISERPVYLSLEPEQIREQFGIPNPDGRKRGSHERRAHLRELRSEKFTFKKGQIVPVKSSWVGPASGTTNDGREYRVLIDKASPYVAGKGKGD